MKLLLNSARTTKLIRDIPQGDVFTFYNSDIHMYYIKTSPRGRGDASYVNLVTGGPGKSDESGIVIHYPDATFTLGEAYKPQ